MSDPREFSATHVLRNGTAVFIRAIRPDDRDRLQAAFSSLEKQSIYTRFFGFKKHLTGAELGQATNVDFDQTVALVVTTGSDESETIIAGARYVGDAALAGSVQAEVAFTVEE